MNETSFAFLLNGRDEKVTIKLKHASQMGKPKSLFFLAKTILAPYIIKTF